MRLYFVVSLFCFIFVQTLKPTILGKNFRRSSLVLNEEGLHRLVRVDLGKQGVQEYRFFLTGDVNKILALMDLRIDAIEDRNDEDVYVRLMVNKYFQLHMFYGDKEEKSKELENIRQFLISYEMDEEDKDFIDKMERLPIRTERVETILGLELREKIDHIKFLIENFQSAYKPKFEAMKVLLMKDGYAPQNFSKDLPTFRKSLGDKLEKMEFWISNTPEEIFEHYKKVTQ